MSGFLSNKARASTDTKTRRSKRQPIRNAQGQYLYSYVNPSYIPPSQRDKSKYRSGIDITTRTVYQWYDVEDTPEFVTVDVFRADDLVLYIGDPVLVSKYEGGNAIVIEKYRIYKIKHLNTSTQTVDLEPARKRYDIMRVTPSVPVTQVRHLKKQVAEERKVDLFEKVHKDKLKKLVKDRTGMNVWDLSDMQKVYIMMRILQEGPKILEIHGLTETDNHLDYIFDTKLREKAFWALWDRDLLRLTKETKLVVEAGVESKA